MTDEMIEVAHKLQEVARQYRKLYENEYRESPVIWIDNNETGECIFLSDSFNAHRIKSRLNGF